MDFSNEQPLEKDIYNGEDINIILSLLDKSSKELLSICDKIDRLKAQITLFIVLLSLLFFLLFYLVIVIEPSSDASPFSIIILFPLLIVIMFICIFIGMTVDRKKKD